MTEQIKEEGMER
jgi:hypothetical protein